jgi:hypothetical protein
MAKIVMQDGSEIRGKIGGKVYSRNGAGAYVRKYVKPVNKNSAGQQTARNNFASISGAFRKLTLGERQTFVDMAPFYKRTDSVGNLVQPTAAQLFARINGKLMQNGVITLGTLKKVCPSPVEVPNTQSIAVSAVSSAPEFILNALFSDGEAKVPADCMLVVSVTPKISFGINRVPDSSFKKTYVLDSGIDTSDPTNFPWADLINSIGGLGGSIDAQYWCEVILFNKETGQESNYIRSPFQIVA